MTRILIVDDDPDNRIILRNALEADGFAVAEACDGIEALREARREPPDLIVSDVLMPAMDGFALCRAAKADPVLEEIPFVFYTATFTEPADERLALDLGASRFIVKPLEPSRFLQGIRAALKARAAGTLPVPERPPLAAADLGKRYEERLSRKLSKTVVALQRERRSLRESEKRYRMLIDAAPDAVFLADAETGLILEANRRAEVLIGRRAQDLVGMHQSQLHPPQESEAYRARFREHVAGIRGDEEMEIQRADGRRVRVSVSVSLFEWNGRRLILGFFRDVSERQRHRQEQECHALALQQALTDTVEAIALAIEKRDPYTAGHQGRVAALASAIARELGLPGGTIQGLHLAALVHDVGKISVPAEILNRPGRLSAPEFGLIRTHPLAGYDILKDIHGRWPLAEMVAQHHERMDGSGYPNGLKGEEICVEARILAVADVVEAISSHRSYRPGLGIAVALNEIEAQAGILYDSAVVAACLRLFREQGFGFDAVS